MSDERSASGQPVYRHDERADFRPAAGDPALIEAVERHLETHVGAPEGVWHQLVSDGVHVDVHVVSATEERPVHTLMTSGMAQLPMTGPHGDTRAELTMLLPGDWPAPGTDPAANWPYELLAELAGLPHQYGFQIGPGDTLPNGDPAEPYAPQTGLACALFVPPLLAPEAFERFELDGTVVHVLGVVLLHRDEMQLKLDAGLEALVDRLDAADVSELLEADRPSAVAKRRWWRR